MIQPEPHDFSWEHYENLFPARYIHTGQFDQEILKVIEDIKPWAALDIGGGKYGTKALRDVFRVFLLDPFIKHMPFWMDGRFNWDEIGRDQNGETFHLVVLRGSINYLSAEQLKIAASATDRALIANTFLEEPQEYRERPYETIHGDEGLEITRYDPSTQTVTHILKPSKSPRDCPDEIVHQFYYRSPEWFQSILPGVEIIPRGKSATLIWKPNR
jgi:hypothetical protein